MGDTLLLPTLTLRLLLVIEKRGKGMGIKYLTVPHEQSQLVPVRTSISVWQLAYLVPKQKQQPFPREHNRLID